jgi:SAM-dependent methyltransferase
MTDNLFHDLTNVYEAMINWPKRLAHEEPFFRQLFEDAEVRNVVDTACGTGQHAAMFHHWGLRVEGADISGNMLQRARDLHGEPPGLRWVERGFDRPIDSVEPFDAAICIGNSLALAPDHATAERAIRQMLAAVRDGGIVVVHVLNIWRFPDGPCVWQKCRRAVISDREVLIVKGVHRCGSKGHIEMVVAETTGEPVLHSESVSFLGFEATELERMAIEGGATSVRSYGDYQNGPFAREKSVDLIMLAKR